MSKRYKIQFWSLLVGFVALYIVEITIYDSYANDDAERYLIFSIISAQFFVSLVILIYAAWFRMRRRIIVGPSFYEYVETGISQVSIGMMVYDKSNIIIWVSPFLSKKGFDIFLGYHTSKLVNEFNIRTNKNSKQVVEFKGFQFEVSFLSTREVIIFHEVTTQKLVEKKYKNERVALMEMEIDNYSQNRLDLGDGGIFKINQILIKVLDELCLSHNMFYRQYLDGKILIFSNEETIRELRKNGFSFIDKIHTLGMKESIKIEISIGVALGGLELDALAESAQEALRQAKSHGGDQVAVLESGSNPQFYGAKFEASSVKSRVKIRNFSAKLAEALNLKSVSNVIIQGHTNTDLDSLGAALGIMAFVRANSNKEAFIANVNWDATGRDAVNSLFNKKERDTIFLNEHQTIAKSNQNTLLIIVDTTNEFLLEQTKIFKVINSDNVFIFDHHRVGKISFPFNIQQTYIDTAASSTAEIVTELISFSPAKVNLKFAELQMLLAAIYLDSNQFTKTTSSRTFAAAAFLEAEGASPNFAIEILKIPSESKKLLDKLLAEVKEVKPGFFVAATEIEAPDSVISKAADEILRVQGRKASFVIARPSENPKFLKLSARSVNTNIQRIAEAVGGGGHFSAAAARTKEPLDIFEENLTNSIVMDRDESYTD